MRCLFLMFLALLALAPAGAQRPRLQLDSLGLPPYPGANSVGNIRLPLGAILKPEPGQTPTGPKLSDLAIQTYRTAPTVPVERIAEFYLKYATDAGWRLLDDIPDSATNRSLVFWSPAAPGYLTVEIVPGPENTRQIDLTRLLGEVDPARPGEVLKLTGKRVREQRVAATFTGRFLNLKTNKFERRTVRAVESRAEAGLPVEAAQWVAPITETYEVTWTVTDITGKMTRVEAFAGNGVKIAEASGPAPVASLSVKGQVRGGQGMMTRVLISGVLPSTPPPPDPNGTVTIRPVPDTPPTGVLTEWYGLRPPRTAVVEIRPGAMATEVEKLEPSAPVDLGPSCERDLAEIVAWRAGTTDEFDFPEDLFGNSFPRARLDPREGTTTVAFERGSGTSNTYVLHRSRTIATTQVQYGYSFNSEWITLPTKKPNPTVGKYVSIVESAPSVERKSSGACPPAGEAAPPPA